MSTPPALPPRLPPAGATSPAKPKSSVPCVLLGCGAVALLGVLVLAVAAFWFFSAKKGPSSVSVSSGGEGGVDLGVGAKISQYEFANASAGVFTSDGVWHAVFQEESDFGKPTFLFHRMSSDGGVTWSAPENISIDGTGNGAGFPKLAKDAQGNVYAAWIQFAGAATSLLDGPGGYSEGNLTLSRWSNGHWDAPKVLGTPGKVFSFCFFAGADGTPQILWVDQGGMVDVASASDAVARVVVAPGTIPDSGGFKFGRCLSALTDANGNVFFIAERATDNSQQVFLWSDAGGVRALLTDPKYATRNTFTSPAQMFADRTGRVHVVCMPSPQTTERNELWDLDPNAGTHQVIFAGRNGEEAVQGFQITAQDGVANVVMEWSAKPAIVATSTDFAALSFDGANWSTARGLTGNSRAEKFFYKDTSVLTGVGVDTRYHAKHASIALDAQGNVHLLGTIAAYSVLGTNSLENHAGRTYNVTSTTSTSRPSLYVIEWK